MAWMPHAKNILRWRSILQARAYRALFKPDGGIPREAEQVLADLRGFCFAARPTIFDPDVAVMARREGRREVFVRIVNMLNLDETTVQKLMEIDDGTE